MTALMMNMAQQRSKELRDYAAARRLAGKRRASLTARPAPGAQDVSIRRLDEADAEAVDRVAGRDSSARPAGDLLGAEIGGELIAAVSIQTGDVVADPVTRPEAARALLLLRAAQLRESRTHGGRRGHRHPVLRGFAARPRRG